MSDKSKQMVRIELIGRGPIECLDGTQIFSCTACSGLDQHSVRFLSLGDWIATKHIDSVVLHRISGLRYLDAEPEVEEIPGGAEAACQQVEV